MRSASWRGRDGGDLGLAAGQADDAVVEQAEIDAQHARRVPFRVDGDEQRLDLFRLVAEPVEGVGDLQQVAGTDVGTGRIAEIDQHVAAAVVLVGAQLAAVVLELEGTAEIDRDIGILFLFRRRDRPGEAGQGHR